MFTIAIVGDLHTFDPASHGRTPGASLPPEQAAARGDADRYHTFSERLLPALMREIAACRPDLLLHTGDLAETGYREPAGVRELTIGLAHLRGVGAPLLLCRGNHDGDVAYAEICGPHTAPVWDGAGVRILTLDDPRYGGPGQLRRLEADLAATCVAASGGGVPRLVLAAHEPAYPLARPFFSEPAYARALRHLAARHPIEALFCGHTHNLAWSVHGAGGRRWMQVKGVGVGFPGSPRLPLASVRAVCDGGEPAELLWGYLEDGAAGWEELILDGAWAVLRWHALGEGVAAETRWRLAPDAPGGLHVESPLLPPQDPPHPAAWPEGAGAVEAALHLAGYGGGGGRCIRVNGDDVATMPPLASFAPRVRVPLPPGALARANRVEIETLPGDRLLVGALALEARLPDGGVRRTPVDPHLHATAADWDAWGEPRLRRVAPGRPITAELVFGR